MFAFPFRFLCETAYEHSEAHILKMYPSVWVQYLYWSAQKTLDTSLSSLHHISVRAMVLKFPFTCDGYLCNFSKFLFILLMLISKRGKEFLRRFWEEQLNLSCYIITRWVYSFRYFVEEIYTGSLFSSLKMFWESKGLKNIFSKFSFSTSKFIFLYEENSSQKKKEHKI